MPIPSGYGQATIVFDGENLPTGGVCTLGFQNTIARSAQACADEFVGPLQTLHQLISSADVTLRRVLVKLGPDATGPSAEATVTEVGGSGSTTVAPNTTLLIAKVTGLGGRKGRGRMFWPGVAEDVLDDDGSLISGFTVPSQAALDAFNTDMGSVDMELMLLHGDATTPSPITSLTLSSLVATQRRRLRR